MCAECSVVILSVLKLFMELFVLVGVFLCIFLFR